MKPFLNIERMLYLNILGMHTNYKTVIYFKTLKDE